MLSGINFAVTIYKMRAPGMTYMRMPVFCWTALCTAILLTFAMPPLTVAALMQALDRYLDFHFFTNDLGGNMMNYANLFWMFGHPEVYILILPAYGIFSELTATYSAKTLYGYYSLVFATMCIAVMSFTVWVHHFFTMGQQRHGQRRLRHRHDADRDPHRREGVRLDRDALPGPCPPHGADGLPRRVPDPVRPRRALRHHPREPDRSTTRSTTSQFIVAHFHNVILPGVVFGVLAGVHMWFPKAFGFRLDEKPARISAVSGSSASRSPSCRSTWSACWAIRARSASYSDPAFEPYMIVTAFGSLLILAAFASFAAVFYVSWRNREALAVPLGDPWDGRTLEWATPAPVPEYNFPVIPEVVSREAFTVEKANGRPYVVPDEYEDIDLPAPTSAGFIICVCAGAFGFAMTWWIWWLAALSLLAIPAVLVGAQLPAGAHGDHPRRRGAAHHRGMDARHRRQPRHRPRRGADAAKPRLCLHRPRARGSRMSDADTKLHPGLNLGPTHGDAHEEAEVVVFGFWVFLMSDLITFGLFFATYATMLSPMSIAGGPGPKEVVDLLSIAGQTTLLLASTLTFGLATIAMKYDDGRGRIVFWMAVTALLGTGFVALEVSDFMHMASIGAVPQRSGFLSAMWALVGLHGLHVSVGIVFVGVMILQIAVIGLDARVKSRVLRLALYWHFLDIVWVAIMSGVFLAGAL